MKNKKICTRCEGPLENLNHSQDLCSICQNKKIVNLDLGHIKRVEYTSQFHQGFKVVNILFENSLGIKRKFALLEPIYEVISQRGAQLKEARDMNQWILENHYDVFEEYQSHLNAKLQQEKGELE